MTHPSPTRRSSELPLRRQRFDELSTLKAHDGDPANAAQLDRRAREDAELLSTLLRGQGYYDAQVTTGIGRSDGKLLVTLTADPGALYHFADVTIDGVLAAGGKEIGRAACRERGGKHVSISGVGVPIQKTK